MKKAIIIVGNQKFIKNNQQADDFYNQIKNFLEQNGCNVSFDLGEPFTKPREADIWVGHSRGADRLRFAPTRVKTLAIGSSSKGAINHPKDNTRSFLGPSNLIPNRYHYVFTEEMKQKILNLLNS